MKPEAQGQTQKQACSEAGAWSPRGRNQPPHLPGEDILGSHPGGSIVGSVFNTWVFRKLHPVLSKCEFRHQHPPGSGRAKGRPGIVGTHPSPAHLGEGARSSH